MPVTEQLPALVGEHARAISDIKFDKVTVWDTGKSKNGKTSTADFVSGLGGAFPPLHELTCNVGIKLPSFAGEAMEDAGQAPAPPAKPSSPVPGSSGGGKPTRGEGVWQEPCRRVERVDLDALSLDGADRGSRPMSFPEPNRRSVAAQPSRRRKRVKADAMPHALGGTVRPTVSTALNSFDAAQVLSQADGVPSAVDGQPEGTGGTETCPATLRPAKVDAHVPVRVVPFSASSGIAREAGNVPLTPS